MKTESQWRRIGLFSHHGIVTPLSSIRSEKSCGIGEFLDLIPLIDFCKNMGFDTIQLLPINDTGNNTSPYSAISSCALDPIFLSLSELPYVKPFLKSLHSLKELNETERVDIHRVKEEKLAWLYPYFINVFPKINRAETYQRFINEHRAWLHPYAEFKILRKHYENAHWSTWPKKHPKILKKEMDFYFFLQYLCFSQLHKVKRYAQKAGCFIMGDVPIFLCSNSADVWRQTDQFFLDQVAGSPPDSFNQFGQKWDLPIYNWDQMRKDHFSWWKKRLKIASHLYHIYRIDHVIGLFRVWAIPKNKGPLQGEFLPNDRSHWENQGRELLEMFLSNAPALPVAEDLGIVPPEVPKVLKEYGICGTKIMHWQRKQQGSLPLHEYEPFSITTLSTHDSPNLEMWWRDSPKEARRLCQEKGWDYHVPLSKEKRLELLTDAHHSKSYFHMNPFQEYLSLFPELSHENPEDERINVAGFVLVTNWTYRFKPSIEEISTHPGLNEALARILK